MAAYQYKRLLWIPVSDRLPQSERDVLTCNIRPDGTKRYWILSYEPDVKKWYDYDYGYLDHPPVAWADIPTYDLN